MYEDSSDPPAELAACYRAILARAEENEIASVATPAISTGVFGYPVDEAAEVAIRTVRAEADELRHVRLVRFVLWDQADLAAHVRVLEG